MAGLACFRAGTVTADARLRVCRGRERWLELDCAALKSAFKERFADE
jgi:hypothetical protein